MNVIKKIRKTERIIIVLTLLVLAFSCKTAKPIPEKPKDPFLGVYFMEFNNPKKQLASYSVEFKKDKTAQVVIFKRNSKNPLVYNGKYLFSKRKKNVVILYFPKNVPSEFFLKNEDGTLSILDDNQKEYTGEKKALFILRKIK